MLVTVHSHVVQQFMEALTGSVACGVHNNGRCIGHSMHRLTSTIKEHLSMLSIIGSLKILPQILMHSHL